MQQICLAGLNRAGFSDKAAFYGGTCLRIFYGLPRSEDMDFSLTEIDDTFSLETYFDAIANEFTLLGREVQIQKKEKSQDLQIESAFLKEKINSTHIEMVKADVRRFVINPQELDIWSTNYFLQITDIMRFAGT
jgi:predicted nucleotidyltransferase component of viral defense system